MIGAKAIKQFFLGPVSRQPEIEFLPAALEIIETPASPAGRGVAATIILFFVIALLWACLGSVDIIAIAQGRIVPSSRTKTIQPFETGVVRAIHVRDGQEVKIGDVLIEIDPTINRAERNRLEAELIQARLEAARLHAAAGYTARSKLALVPPEGASAGLIALQERLLASQVEEIRAKLLGLDKQIAQSEANQRAVQSTIEKLTETIPILKKRLDIWVAASKLEWADKMRVLTAKQEYVEQKKELQVQQGRLAEAVEGVAALNEQRRQAEAEFRHKTLDDLAVAEQKIASLQEQLVQAGQRLKLQTLTAPVDGTVQQLAIHTEGGVVTPAQALLTIVPAGSPLEIEANISNRDIGFVSPGQEAAIKVDTFNFTKYGLLSGSVDAVSQDAVMRERPIDADSKNRQTGAESESSEPKGQELVYTARIKLDQAQMQVDGKQVNLTPGMAVTAEIKTGQRRIIEYLLSPLTRHSQQALRER
jgi:membrane fusion protein, hemolysin D